MLGWLKSLFRAPHPAGPEEPIRRFTAADPPLSRDGVTSEGEGWRIAAAGPRAVRLFEVAAPEAEACLLAYRATVRAEGLGKRAYLVMWCRFGGQEYFSKGFDSALTGTVDWTTTQTPFFLKPGQRPDLIRLEVAMEGAGTLWLKDVGLFRTPLAFGGA
jgi:hypothetical protein